MLWRKEDGSQEQVRIKVEPPPLKILAHTSKMCRMWVGEKVLPILKDRHESRDEEVGSLMVHWVRGECMGRSMERSLKRLGPCIMEDL